eukprot:TRINITY_DN1814_c0_g1_i2.p1 TRINITY_DN1814_c0_g1~~TRINITY_DN1814_c0_g1_i2.p1  ORF type:complete len:279 (-),score=47.94 TRINITY_DN1814_c0_g1_i2:486-1322(-)
MDKSNWGRQDRWAFKVYDRYCNGTMGQNSPLLDLAECMVMRSRCTVWMTDDTAEEFSQLLKDAAQDDGLQIARSCFCCADIAQDHDHLDLALGYAEKGLGLGCGDVQDGMVPMLHFVYGLVQHRLHRNLIAQHHFSLAGSFGSDHAMAKPLSFRLVSLNARVNSALEQQEVHVLSVSAGYKQSLVAKINHGTEVCWEWGLDAGNDVGFTATFQPAGSEAVEIQPPENRTAEQGPGFGNFSSPADGTVTLEWDNSFSYLRSKTVRVRVTPETKFHLVDI